MAKFAQEILPVTLVDEMKNSYRDYAMSVIAGRALPDARDGLKPVHRRILFSMHKQGNSWNKKYVKSATIVGDVMGKYHPHGDSAIYSSLVRLAQDFSLRYPLVDGQGNFGSIDGDGAAAHRYTEARMSRIAHSLLEDIERDTVDFVANYDGSQQEPAVLPTRLPHLLLNGTSGIAVGLATNIPPHHLGELLDGCLHLLDNPNASVDELMVYVKGPDFPTGGIINGAKGIRDAYATGAGRIYLRAKTHFEEDEGRKSIVVDEIPYQVLKSNLMIKIAELVKNKRLEGISALRDESDKDGIRLVIELKRGENPDVVLNNLFRMTPLEDSFSINMTALVGGRPRQLTLHEALRVYLNHRREVITRRSIFELAKARERAHILEGLSVALHNVDQVIEQIRRTRSSAEAREVLQQISWPASDLQQLLGDLSAEQLRPDDVGAEFGLQAAGYRLSPVQVNAILELRLHRLTGLEQEKIADDFSEHLALIRELLAILASDQRLVEVLKAELQEIREQFNDQRRTEIAVNYSELRAEDFIADEDCVITLSHEGYIKSQPLTDYEAQQRGGVGKSATSVKDEDFIKHLIVAKAHDTLQCFTSKGKVYQLRAFEVPMAGRGAKGRPVVNMLNLEEGERLTNILPVRDFAPDQFLIAVTARGMIKKTPLTEYASNNIRGKRAILLQEDDQLVDVAIGRPGEEIMLFASNGRAIRFLLDDLRTLSRTSRGVKGMRLEEQEKVIALTLVSKDQGGEILTVTENGFGKRSLLSDYPIKGRHGKGVIDIKCSERNGAAVASLLVSAEDDVMLITDNGMLIRTPAADISVIGRNSQGVRLIKPRAGEKVIAVAKVLGEEN